MREGVDTLWFLLVVMTVYPMVEVLVVGETELVSMCPDRWSITCRVLLLLSLQRRNPMPPYQGNVSNNSASQGYQPNRMERRSPECQHSLREDACRDGSVFGPGEWQGGWLPIPKNIGIWCRTGP